MSRQLPKELMDKPNGHIVIMDRSNVSHRPHASAGGRAACGIGGTPVTLAQAIAWGGAWCAHGSCYAPPHTSRGRR